MSARLEYRLSWQSVDGFYAAAQESRGRDVWSQLDDEAWDALPWEPTTVNITTDPWDQFHTLRRWAQSHEQPVRNVKLEQREVPDPDGGWAEVHSPLWASDAAKRRGLRG